MDRCEIHRRAEIANDESVLLRCRSAAEHTITIRRESGSHGPDLYFVLHVCESCVAQLTGWH